MWDTAPQAKPSHTRASCRNVSRERNGAVSTDLGPSDGNKSHLGARSWVWNFRGSAVSKEALHQRHVLALALNEVSPPSRDLPTQFLFHIRYVRYRCSTYHCTERYVFGFCVVFVLPFLAYYGLAGSSDDLQKALHYEFRFFNGWSTECMTRCYA